MSSTDHNPAEDTPRGAALHYARLGLRVVPIRPGGKAPAVSDWPHVATTNHDQIDRWWPDHAVEGVGIVTGPATWGQFFVLDLDRRPEHDGHDTLHELEQAYGPLPDTWRVITGSGGTHIYLRVPDGHPCPRNDQAALLGPGIDIRGDGGQVLAPPTRHPTTGQPYAWETAPGELDLLDLDIADAPGWLLALLDRPPPEPIAAVRTEPRGDRPGDRFNSATGWAQLLHADGAILAGTGYNPDGTTHERWVRPGKAVVDGPSATVNYCGNGKLYNFSSNWPGLEPNRSYDRWGYHVATRWHGDFTAATRAAGELERSHDIDVFVATPGELTPVAAVVVDGIFVDDWAAFLNRVFVDDWSIPDLLAKGRGHVIYAPAKTGKSLFLLWQCVQALRSDPTLFVVYFDLEMTDQDVQERLIDMGCAPAELERLRYAILPPIRALDTQQGADGMLAILDAEIAAHPGLHPVVVIDTTARTITGDENDSSTYIAWATHAGTGLKRRRVTWVRVDHAGKDLDRGQRGSSAKNDDVDVVWQITKMAGALQLKKTFGRPKWIPDVVVWDELDSPHRYRLRGPASTDLTPRQADLVAALERLSVPLELGRVKAGERLRAAGVAHKASDLVAAQRYRTATAGGELLASESALTVPSDPGNVHVPNYPGNAEPEKGTGRSDTGNGTGNALGTAGGGTVPSGGPSRGPRGNAHPAPPETPQPPPPDEDWI